MHFKKMVRNTVFFSIILFTILLRNTYGQSTRNPSHVLGFETGLYNRGLVGLSYQRLFLQTERFIVGSGAGLGVGGVPFGRGINQFYYLTFSAGIGILDNKTQLYLSPGADLKYINFYDGVFDETTDQYLSVNYEGLGVMPYLGLIVLKENLFMQMRVAPLFLMNKFEISQITPGIGLTAGYLIRN